MLRKLSVMPHSQLHIPVPTTTMTMTRTYPRVVPMTLQPTTTNLLTAPTSSHGPCNESYNSNNNKSKTTGNQYTQPLRPKQDNTLQKRFPNIPPQQTPILDNQWVLGDPVPTFRQHYRNKHRDSDESKSLQTQSNVGLHSSHPGTKPTATCTPTTYRPN